MERTISTAEARRNLGRILDACYRGDHYIVERAGKPMVAVVPIAQYMKWRERRNHLFAMIDDARQRNRGVPPDVIEAEVDESVHEVRNNGRKMPR